VYVVVCVLILYFVCFVACPYVCPCVVACPCVSVCCMCVNFVCVCVLTFSLCVCVCVCSGVLQVDSQGEVNQFLPRHGQTMLDKLNGQRLCNQFCDITLLIEGEEHRAHKAVLAACSDYFHTLFVEKGAVSTHEAVVDLSGTPPITVETASIAIHVMR